MKSHPLTLVLQKILLITAIGLTSNLSFSFEHTPGFSLSLMGGEYYPAKNRLIEDSSTSSLGLGYDFSNGWGIELNGTLAEPEFTNTTTEFDAQIIGLDALYHFNRGRFQPYISFGAGQLEYTYQDDTTFDDATGQFGLGAKFFLTSWLAIRAEGKAVRGFDSGENDNVASAGIVLKFGGSKPKATPTPTPIPTPIIMDGDGDGVADALDLCLNTRSGVAVNVKGCMIDADKDGVADADDKCPDTEPGARVKADGCYMVLKEDVSVQLHVKFGTGSAEVISNSYDEINKLAQFLKEYPQTKVVIEGHSDSSGAAEYNRKLSQRRAAAVARILVEQFIVDPNRVSAIGYGEDRPLVPNDSPENRAKNRRVTAVVSTQIERVIK